MTTDDKGFIWLYNDIDKAISVIAPNTHTFKKIDKKAGLFHFIATEILQDNNRNICITTIGGSTDIIYPTTEKIK